MENQDGQGSTKVPSREQPIEITAERLIADNRARTAVFEGSVVARQGKITLYADWMKVIYSEGNDVKEILAKGKVKLSQKEREITSEEALYYRDEQKIVFTGNPVAREGKNTISGSKMIYYIDKDRSIVENTRVILKKQKGPQDGT